MSLLHVGSESSKPFAALDTGFIAPMMTVSSGILSPFANSLSFSRQSIEAWTAGFELEYSSRKRTILFSVIIRHCQLGTAYDCT